MRSITSANVACGFHAGDPSVMRRTIRLARERGVAIGAHPASRTSPASVAETWPPRPRKSKISFSIRLERSPGSRRPKVSAFSTSRRTVLSTTWRPATAASQTPSRVRPHHSIDRSFCSDCRVQRFSMPDASLASASPPRRLPIGHANPTAFDLPAFAARHRPRARSRGRAVLRMARDGSVIASDGSIVRLSAETVCVHGDTPGAADLVARAADGSRARRRAGAPDRS